MSHKMAHQTQLCNSIANQLGLQKLKVAKVMNGIFTMHGTGTGTGNGIGF